jgi:hypothetical protein
MERLELLLEPARELLVQIGQFLPLLGLALLVLVAGWLLAKLAMLTVVKALRAINLNVLTERSGIDDFLRQGGISSDTTMLFGLLVYWLVILAALFVAFNTLGLAYVADVLGKVILFVPKVIVAMLVIVFGAYFARFTGSAVSGYCRSVGIRDSDLIGTLAQYAIMVFVVLIGLDTIDVGGEIVRQAFLIILAGVVFALALAFGLGGRHWAETLLERWWPTRPRTGEPPIAAGDRGPIATGDRGIREAERTPERVAKQRF